MDTHSQSSICLSTRYAPTKRVTKRCTHTVSHSIQWKKKLVSNNSTASNTSSASSTSTSPTTATSTNVSTKIKQDSTLSQNSNLPSSNLGQNGHSAPTKRHDASKGDQTESMFRDHCRCPICYNPHHPYDVSQPIFASSAVPNGYDHPFTLCPNRLATMCTNPDTLLNGWDEDEKISRADLLRSLVGGKSYSYFPGRPELLLQDLQSGCSRSTKSAQNQPMKPPKSNHVELEDAAASSSSASPYSVRHANSAPERRREDFISESSSTYDTGSEGTAQNLSGIQGITPPNANYGINNSTSETTVESRSDGEDKGACNVMNLQKPFSATPQIKKPSKSLEFLLQQSLLSDSVAKRPSRIRLRTARGKNTFIKQQDPNYYERPHTMTEMESSMRSIRISALPSIDTSTKPSSSGGGNHSYPLKPQRPSLSLNIKSLHNNKPADSDRSSSCDRDADSYSTISSDSLESSPKEHSNDPFQDLARALKIDKILDVKPNLITFTNVSTTLSESAGFSDHVKKSSKLPSKPLLATSSMKLYDRMGKKCNGKRWKSSMPNTASVQH